MMIQAAPAPTASALIQADQPWGDAELAQLYDVFPFSADLPFYLELASSVGGEVLELCCGSGRLLLPLAQAGHRLVGLDASPHMLALTCDKLVAAGPEVAERARLVQGDLRSFELGQRFDLALIAVKSFSYLTSRSDQQLALERIVAHLRPGGRLALDLLHPALSWLAQPPGSLNQDL